MKTNNRLMTSAEAEGEVQVSAEADIASLKNMLESLGEGFTLETHERGTSNNYRFLLDLVHEGNMVRSLESDDILTVLRILEDAGTRYIERKNDSLLYAKGCALVQSAFALPVLPELEPEKTVSCPASSALEQQKERLASRHEAIAEATRLNLMGQVEIHREKLELQEYELEAIEVGYERISFEDDMSGCPIDGFLRAIPLDALKAMAETGDIFEDMQIWKEHGADGDTLIVGQRIVSDRKSSFLIARW